MIYQEEKARYTDTQLPLLMRTIPLNKTELSQCLLNIEQKQRSNVFPWNGQFSPQLIEVLLKNYTNSSSCVFDPFMGSGTVLVESAALGLSVFGTEINPAAFQFASTYLFCNMNLNKREKHIKEIQKNLNNILNYDSYNDSSEGIKNNISNHKLQKIFVELQSLESQKLYKTLLLLLDYKIKEVTYKRLKILWDRLCYIIRHLPQSDQKILPLNRDARKTMLPDNTFDIIVTSPPYINVFNYHQQYRRTSEEFGYDLLEVAKSEIGANRKNRGNRFLTVIQYVLDMALVFKELKRICKDDARVIFIIGRESNVRKTKFFNAEIITNIADRNAGFKPILRQERVFKNRFGKNIFEELIHFKPSFKRKTGFSANSLLDSHSELASLRPSNLDSEDLFSTEMTNPYNIALETLVTARQYCPRESVTDLEDAIERLYDVKPSPLFSINLN